MAVTSALQHALQNHPKFDKALCLFPPRSPPIWISNLSIDPRVFHFRALGNRRLNVRFPVVCAKSAKEENERERKDTQSYGGSTKISKSHQSTSTGGSVKKKHGAESNSSSVRTVALCLMILLGMLCSGLWYWSGFERRSRHGI